MLRIRPGTTDVSVFNQVYIKKAYAADGPQAPALVLDLGAYTGISTRWFCDRYPGAQVVAVEPDPGRAALIQRNAPRARVVRAAVSGKAGSAVLSRTKQGEWADTIMSSGRPVAQVRVVTVDDVLDGALPDVVKVDIEGAERDVFQTAGDWLMHVRLLFVETHDRYVPGCRAALDDALARTGRRHKVQVRGGGKVDADLAVFFND